MARLGVGSRKEWRELRRGKTSDGVLGNVLIDRRGNAFSILETKTGKLAISTTELTCEALSEFCRETKIDRKLKASELPFEIYDKKDIKLVLDYCNWLGQENQLAESQLCYPLTIELAKVAKLTPRIAGTGFRLPSLEEYREFNSKSGPMLRLKMDSKAIALDYAWAFQNAVALVQPVGTRLPNSIGVFDSLGNLQELGQSQHKLDTEWCVVGQTVRAEVGAFDVTLGSMHPTASTIALPKVGIRIVRRMD